MKAVFPAVFIAFFLISPAYAANSVPKVLNYQARVTDSGGVPVPNGALSVIFRLYDGDGTCLYSARGSCGTPTAKSVTVTNGVFSTQLGEAGDNEIPDGLFDNNVVTLGITIGADAEMTPRKRLTAAAYALNADRLDDLDVTSSGSTTAYIPSTTANGNLVITGDPQGTGVGNGSFYINPANAAASETLFGIADNGGVRFQIDKEGDITHTGSLLATAASSTAQFVFRGAASQTNGVFGIQDASQNRLLTVSATSTLIGADASAYRVGIGMASPTALLHLADTANAQLKLQRIGASAQAGTLNFGNQGSLIANSRAAINNYVLRNDGALHLIRNLIFQSVDWELEANGTGALLEVGEEGISLWTAPSSTAGTQNLAILFMARDDGDIAIPANVGIGIAYSDPTVSVPLYVQGTTSEIMKSIRNSALTNVATTGLRVVQNSSNSSLADGFGMVIQYAIDSPSIAETVLAEVGGIRYGADNSGAIVFNTYNAGAGTEKARILPNGYFGIGNAAPANKLTVGSATSTFEVDFSGNVRKINNVIYSWPASQGGASTVLQNDGNGVLTWASSSGGNLNQAYLAATGSPEISLTPSVGAVTIADTLSGTGNIFEITDRTTAAGDFSRRYFTVSSTSTNLAYNNLSSGTAFGVSSSAAFSGNLMALAGTANFTGDLLELTSAASFGRGIFIDYDAGNNDGTIIEIMSDETSVSGTSADTQKFAVSAAGSITGDGNLTIGGSTNLGDSTGTDTLVFTSGATTGSLALFQTSGSVSTGNVIRVTSTNNTMTTGRMLTTEHTAPNVVSAFTGFMNNFEATRTFSSAGTYGESGSIARVQRSLTSNGGSVTVNASGDVMLISSDGTQTSGTLNITGSVLELAQNYASASGAALNIVNAGTGADIALPATAIIDIGNGGTLIFRDGTNTLCTITDAGTTGDFSCSGTISGASGGNLNQAYLAATGSPELSITPSVGALTIGDTFGGTGNIFEVQDRTNAAGDYSIRMFSVSATGTRIASDVFFASGGGNDASVAFIDDPDTGFANGGTNRIDFITAGQTKIILEDNFTLFGSTELIVNGGVIDFGASSGFLAATPTILEVGGAATTLIMGANGPGTTRIRNSLVVNGDPQGTGLSNGTVYVNPSAPTGNETLFSIANNGSLRFKLDAEGDIDVTGSMLAVSASTTSQFQLRGFAAQSNNIFEVQDSFTNRLFSVSSTSTRYINRLIAPAHAVNQGLQIPTFAGVPTAVTGTAEGDLVWDSTGNSLYAYNGAAFAAIGGTTNLNQAYLVATGTAEISLTPSVGALTIADTLSGTGNIFEIQNRTTAAGDYSTRYMTVSSTGTTVTNLTITGICTGCGGASPSLNQAYLAATGSPEISITPSVGALTIADTFSGTGNIFEITNRTNPAGDYSARYFTVSGTATSIATKAYFSRGGGNDASIAFIGDEDTGLSNGNDNRLDVVIGGATTMIIDDNVTVVGSSEFTVNGGVINIGASFGQLASSPTTLELAHAATTLTLGATTGTTTTRNSLVVGSSSSTHVLNTTGARITGNLTPSADNTYNLGDYNRRWKDLWLSGGSAHIAYNTSGTTSLDIGWVNRFAHPTNSLRARLFSSGQPIQITPNNGETAGLYIDTAGRVGMGTTLPTIKLHVEDNVADFVAYFDNNGSADTRVGIIIEGCADNNPTSSCELISFRDGDGTGIGRVRGNASGGVTYATTGAGDFGERLPGDPWILTDGYLVAVGEAGVALKATNSANLIGVANDNIVFAGNDDLDPATSVPVAMLGLADAYVNVENGVIKAGDLIALSSTPGVGMKATKPGMVVGRAMQDWSGPGLGKIQVHVSPQWHSGLSITNDGASSIFADDFAFKPLDIASATGTAFSSYALKFGGSVWDSASNTAVTRNISMRNNVSTPDIYQLEFKNTVGGTLASLNQAGDLALAGSLTVNGGLDYAETFPAAPDLDAGDIVMVDAANTNGYGVKKSDAAYENTLLGVISTKPGFLTGKSTAGTQPVALAGRVPVKVNTESGEIKPGDPITSSSTPGVGMKAAEAGRVIGIALEGWNGSGTGRITVFVNPSWWNGPAALAGAIAGGTLSTNGETLIDLKNSTLAGVSAIVSTSGLWSVTSDGILAAQKVEAKSVQAENVVLVQSESAASVSEGVVPEGYNATLVRNPSMTSNAKVFVSFLGDPGGGYWIGEKGEGDFTLHLARPATQDLPFEYWILGVDDRRPSPPTGTDESTPLSDGSPPIDPETTGSASGTEETEPTPTGADPDPTEPIVTETSTSTDQTESSTSTDASP
ncbi:MAG: hypothetical protein QY323_05060 [Patescibacteria group bacterium]|nr:MAG: hypothetical protein QY323_05060 [Patescibacteria group bacterium]